LNAFCFWMDAYVEKNMHAIHLLTFKNKQQIKINYSFIWSNIHLVSICVDELRTNIN
jgi:hypothetical protein